LRTKGALQIDPAVIILAAPGGSSQNSNDMSKEIPTMASLKNKVSETASHMKNAVTETVDKVGHAASEAVHKGDHALSDMARKAVGLGVETIDKLKEVANHVAAKPQNGAAAAGDEGKATSPGQKAKGPRDKTKKAVN
jgi:hypothetical protein